ncbi:39S ribosomal protein L17, mitochondrial [Aphelenchoides fujianensis]|nr:39S ribosomal protein L17, mitochondrial [Aphelenchoides fujianensis]KAI6242448.1 39S ribosomal protein L17, mitochondrial [Aphelenchoides fujianensis]
MASTRAIVEKVARTLPKVKVEIGHIPQRLKTADFPTEHGRGRLEILRRMMTRLVREERCEFILNRAVEFRAYAERLIQLGVHRGAGDEYTNEMVEWWIMEPALRDKFYAEICARLRDTAEPYTTLIRLPAERMCRYKDKNVQRWTQHKLGMLEINGHPFPSVLELEDMRKAAVCAWIKQRTGATATAEAAAKFDPAGDQPPIGSN